MKTAIFLLTAFLLGVSQPKLLGDPKPSKETPEGVSSDADRGKPSPSDSAEKRYDEMLSKMREAVQSIAESYGNPMFVQVFTNDREKAVMLKQRLQSSKRGEEIRLELTKLEKRRDELMNDIALKSKEASMLSDRLARQRSALDALAAVIERANNAVEDTSR
jgi:hypothetical protein